MKNHRDDKQIMYYNEFVGFFFSFYFFVLQANYVI